MEKEIKKPVEEGTSDDAKKTTDISELTKMVQELKETNNTLLEDNKKVKESYETIISKFNVNQPEKKIEKKELDSNDILSKVDEKVFKSSHSDVDSDILDIIKMFKKDGESFDDVYNSNSTVKSLLKVKAEEQKTIDNNPELGKQAKTSKVEDLSPAAQRLSQLIGGNRKLSGTK